LELYTLGEKIGTGKFSIVFKGKEKATEQEYAIKVITKMNLSQDEMYMLANETEMFRFLNHMGIIKVKEIFENRSHIYIIAELVKDGDLFDYVLQ
jgi:serine/threonine protein kinase